MGAISEQKNVNDKYGPFERGAQLCPGVKPLGTLYTVYYIHVSPHTYHFLLPSLSWTTLKDFFLMEQLKTAEYLKSRIDCKR